MYFTCEEENGPFQDRDGLNGAAHAFKDAIMTQIEMCYFYSSLWSWLMYYYSPVARRDSPPKITI
jgi:hypothetical protein